MPEAGSVAAEERGRVDFSDDILLESIIKRLAHDMHELDVWRHTPWLVPSPSLLADATAISRATAFALQQLDAAHATAWKARGDMPRRNTGSKMPASISMPPRQFFMRRRETRAPKIAAI